MNRGRPGTYAEAASYHRAQQARFLYFAGETFARSVYRPMHDGIEPHLTDAWLEGYYLGHAWHHGLEAQRYAWLDECSRREVSP